MLHAGDAQQTAHDWIFMFSVRPTTPSKKSGVNFTVLSQLDDPTAEGSLRRGPRRHRILAARCDVHFHALKRPL